MFASKKDHKNIVRVLIEKGADANIKDKQGQTASYYTKEDDIKELLTNPSANPTKK